MMILADIGKPFIPDWSQLRPFIAELWLMLAIVGVLLAPFRGKRSNAVSGGIALAGLLAAFISLLVVHAVEPSSQLRGMLIADGFAFFWKAILLLFAIGIVLMWATTTSASMHPGDAAEFFTLLLGAVIGMCLMASTTNLLMIFIAVEMSSLPSYVLAGFRKTDRLGSEASLKYVVFGAAASAIMVYGLSLLYGLFGTLQLQEMALKLVTGEGGLLASIALAGIIIGIGFKISAVPLHFWCPDVFEGAGVDVAAFLSVASKGAALALLMRIVMTLGSAAQFTPMNVSTGLAITLGLMGAITATVGNTAAFVQTNIKRLLAYSSIAHAGYMLCILSLVVRTSAGADQATLAAQALLVYLAVYLFMNLGAFTVAGLIYRETGSEKIEDYAALGRRNPLLAFCMAVCMFSLVGLPPFAGFVAKLNVMYVLGHNGGWWWALVAVIGANTIFSLYYYARVVRTMYMGESDKGELAVNPLGTGLSLACAAMLVIMLVGFNPLMKLAGRYSNMLLPGTGGTTQTAQAEKTGPTIAQAK